MNQLIGIIVDKFNKNYDSKSEDDRKQYKEWDCYKILFGVYAMFSLMCRNEFTKWQGFNLNNKLFGFQGVAMILFKLDERATKLSEFREYSVAKLLAPLLSCLSDQNSGYNMLKQVTKVATMFICLLKIGCEAFSYLYSYSEDCLHPWKRILALHSFTTIFSSKNSLSYLISLSSKANYIDGILKYSDRRIITSLEDLHKKHKRDNTHINEKDAELIDLNANDEPPIIKQQDVDFYSSNSFISVYCLQFSESC